MKIDTSSLEKALNSLNEVLELEETPIIRDSAIQRFSCTYELSIKMLRRQLEKMSESAVEVEHLSYSDLIRVGAEKGLLDDPTKWFNFREKRNTKSNTYKEDKAEEVYSILLEFAKSSSYLLKKIIKQNSEVVQTKQNA